MKKALITGVTGQIGSHLAEFLVDKGYEVHGIIRRTSHPSFGNLAYLLEHPKQIELYSADLTDQASLTDVMRQVQPDEIYNLAAQSFVPTSWTQPVLTADVTGLGVMRMFEAMRTWCPKARFYQASSSEVFGKVRETPQTETTPFYPRSPYGCAKAFGHQITVNMRESYGLFAVSGICFNAEGPRRGEEFVTRKITKAVAAIARGFEDKLVLGNLDARRDWGFAGDYCIGKDVPILTPKGWAFFDDVSDGDEVINFDPVNDRLSRDVVRKKISLKSSGRKIVIQGRGVHIRVTPDHRIYFQKKFHGTGTKNWSGWQVTTAQEMFERLKHASEGSLAEYRLPHFQDYDGREFSADDDEIYLTGALLAEGSLQQCGAYKTARVSLSQSLIANERTHDRIERAMDNLGLKRRTRQRADGVVEWSFDAESSRAILEGMFDKPNIHIMPRWCYQLSARQSNILFEALMDCDGCWGSMVYSSKRTLLAADFQTVAHLAGYRTTNVKLRKDGMSTVGVVSRRKKYCRIQSVTEVQEEEQEVWCVETGHGTIVTRDEGCISISGNCDAMWRTLQQPEPSDYVIATGEQHSVREFCEVAFRSAGLDWEKYVTTDPKFVRPAEVDVLVGDPRKILDACGWRSTTRFEDLVNMMVRADAASLRREYA